MKFPKIRSIVLPAINWLVSHTGWRIWVAISATLIMLAGQMILDRTSQSVAGEEITMKRFRFMAKALGLSTDMSSVPDRFLLINIGYDRQLAPVADEFGMPLGDTDVTHRDRLHYLLENLEGAPYRAIVLDVAFDAALPADGDSALFGIINSLPRIVVPAHSDMQMTRLISPEKFATSEYNINFNENNFVKYPYFDDNGRPSIALRAFLSASGYNDDKYRVSDILSTPSLYLPLESDIDNPYDAQGNKTWLNLGADVIDVYSRDELHELASGRTVIIGDFTNADFHDTYVGNLSGAVIIMNAIMALEAGRRNINVWSAILAAIVYFMICYCLVSQRSVWDMIKVRPSGIWRYMVSILGFSTALLALALVQYACFSEMHDAFFTGTFLAIYTLICQYFNNKYPYAS